MHLPCFGLAAWLHIYSNQTRTSGDVPRGEADIRDFVKVRSSWFSAVLFWLSFMLCWFWPVYVLVSANLTRSSGDVPRGKADTREFVKVRVDVTPLLV
jgi:hypothetical protein